MINDFSYLSFKCQINICVNNLKPEKRLLRIQEKYCSCTKFILVSKHDKSNYDKIVFRKSQRKAIIPCDLHEQLDAESTSNPLPRETTQCAPSSSPSKTPNMFLTEGEILVRDRLESLKNTNRTFQQLCSYFLE